MKEIKRKSNSKIILIFVGILVIMYGALVLYSLSLKPSVTFSGVENGTFKYELDLPLGIKSCSKDKNESSDSYVNGDDFVVACKYSWVPFVSKNTTVEVSGLYKKLTADNKDLLMSSLVNSFKDEYLEYVLLDNNNSKGSTLYLLYNKNNNFEIKFFSDLYLSSDGSSIVQTSDTTASANDSDLSIIEKSATYDEYNNLVKSNHIKIFDVGVVK